MEKRVTMSMIAEACRTSIGTVDRALHNRAGINPETRQMILDTAKSLGYKTNKLAGALSRKSRIRIAFIDPAEPEDFYGHIHKGVRQAASELAPYGIEVDMLLFDPREPGSQQKLLSSVDGAGYDGVAVNPQSGEAAGFIERLSSMGIPTVTFNNDLPGSSRLFYVGVDSGQSGRMAGDIMGTLLGGRGSVTVMGNYRQIMPFIDRFQGFCDVIRECYSDIVIYPSPDCRRDLALTEKNLEKLLTAIPDIGGVFCTNYFTTVGAIRALRKLGRTDIRLIGYDISQEGLQAIRDGVCQMLLYQDPYQQGYQVIHLLAKHLLEDWRPVADKLLLETRLVFRQNIGNYSDGILKWDSSLR